MPVVPKSTPMIYHEKQFITGVQTYSKRAKPLIACIVEG